MKIVIHSNTTLFLLSLLSQRYLGDIVHLGELEGDPEATKERRDERASVRELSHGDFRTRRAHGGC